MALIPTLDQDNWILDGSRSALVLNQWIALNFD
jgi:hypothetical protein